MRQFRFLLTLGLIVAGLSSAEAAVSKGVKKKSAKAARQARVEQLQTNHNFDDQSVIGEYQVPDEALARVEAEKGLSDLLGVRKHFKDRLLEASHQE